jgi:hypothetical protein
MRAIGSEKINNIDDRLARIKQIAGITENTNKVDQNATIIHEAVAVNGEQYAIIQENKYVYIKKKINESYEYMTGINNIKEFSYKTTADALKHLNLMFKEINELNEHKQQVDILKKKVV